MVGCCVIVESVFLSVCAFITRFIYSVNHKVVCLGTFFVFFIKAFELSKNPTGGRGDCSMG